MKNGCNKQWNESCIIRPVGNEEKRVDDKTMLNYFFLYVKTDEKKRKKVLFFTNDVKVME